MLPIDRRTFIVGAGSALALPKLESAFGAPIQPPQPNFCTLYFPNGVVPEQWFTKTSRVTDAKSLTPLKDLEKDLLLVRNLRLAAAEPGLDGAGDHARAASAFLTCQRPFKTEAEGIRVGRSFDEALAAARLSSDRYSTLAIQAGGGRKRGVCDAGYSCVYVNNLSWVSPSQPISTFTDPTQLFDSLFPTPERHAAEIAKSSRRRSILDFVLGDAKRFSNRLMKSDQVKLDEYLTSVRSVESRIANLPAEAPQTDFKRPNAVSSYDERVRILLSLSTLALQSGATKCITFMFARELSEHVYDNLGIAESHHSLTHHGNNPDLVEKVAKINQYHAHLFGTFMRDLSEKQLLTHTVSIFGTGIRDGNIHDHDDIPILVGGGKGIGLDGGRIIEPQKSTPLANLYVGIAKKLGVGIDRFADSVGSLTL